MNNLIILFLFILIIPISVKSQILNEPTLQKVHKEIFNFEKEEVENEISPSTRLHEFKAPLAKRNSFQLNKSFIAEDLLDSVIYVDDGSTYKETFSYDNSIRKLVTIKQTISDSGTWVNISKISNTYDETENRNTETYQKSENDEWMNYRQIVSVFNDNGSLLSRVRQYPNNGVWRNSIQEVYKYDIMGNKLSEEWQYWSHESNKWVNDERTQYTYDQESNLLTESREYWDETWVTHSLYTNTYNSRGYVLTQLRQDLYITFELVNVGISTYSYNEFDSILTIIYKHWDHSAELWTNAQLQKYTYDSHGFLIYWLYQRWITGEWKNSERINFENDANGNALNEHKQYWSANSESWRDRYRKTSTYDANGNILSYTYELVDYTSGQLQFTTRSQLTYTRSGKRSTYLREYWNLYYEEFRVENRQEWIYDLNENLTRYTSENLYGNSVWHPSKGWVSFTNNSYDYEFSCEDLTAFYDISSTLRNKNTNFFLDKNYPNPFNGVTSIPIKIYKPGNYKLQIFNLLGQKVNNLYSGFLDIGAYDFEWNGKNSANGSISSGLYFYRLSGDKGTVKTRKAVYVK